MNVLIVDDEFAVIRLARKILRNHETHVASDMETAVTIAASTHPDVVVMDIYMNGTYGIDWIAEIMKASPRSLVVVMTGQATWDLMSSAYAAGARAFVDKVDLGLLDGILGYLFPSENQHDRKS
jgi:DNA-binding NtrC family response regulator